MSCTPPKKNHPWHHPVKGKKRRRTPPAKALPADRRVFVTLELETATPLVLLSSKEWWANTGFPFRRVLQAQANVAQT